MKITPPRLVRAGLVLAVLAACTPSVHAATGGPDLTGYTWRDSADGAAFQVVGFTTVTRITPPANSVSGPFPMNFGSGGFRFYGRSYNNVWISDNGWISFEAPADSAPVPSLIPNAAGPRAMVAPLWKDLNVGPTGRISFGRNNPLDAFRLQYTGIDPSSNTAFNFDVLLFGDGRIQFQYVLDSPPGAGTVGIEKDPNFPPLDGLQIAGGGATAPGVNFAAGYVIEFFPPPLLPATCATIPSISCGSTGGTSPAAGTNVIYYGCATTLRQEAQEQVYSFTLTTPSLVDLTLNAATNLTLWVLSECNERSCMRGPGISHSMLLGAGTYWVSVDGPLDSDEGGFTLNLACTAIGEPLTCGNSTASTTVGGPSRWVDYPCSGGLFHSGPEKVYSVTVATPTNLRASLVAAPGPLDIMILRPTTGEITEADCVAFGDVNAVAWDAAPGEYLIVIDGQSGASGPFQLSTSCQVALNCGAPAGQVDFTSGTVQTFSGDTSDETDTVQVYACDPNTTYDGPDEVIEVTLAQDGYLGIIEDVGPGLSYFVVSACNEGACAGVAGRSACRQRLTAGTYYVVVDGENGLSGAYELTLVVEPTFNRWSVCELPAAGVTIDTTSATQWGLSDQAFCITDPNSFNYPNGCIFAMYMVIRCGTEINIPMFDSEGGHLRIFDILRGEYLVLTASSPTWFHPPSTEIQWQDTDCLAGSDPRWNEVTTNVFYERPEGLCGIFRIEFINHSGNVWDLFANCTGTNEPGFFIHDSLCAALADYDPLPAVALNLATATYNCPDITVTYELENFGCTAAENFPLTLLDAGNEVHVETIPVIAPGQILTGSFTATFTPPTSNVSLENDPLNLLLECDEVAGAACGLRLGSEVAFLLGCTGSCDVSAQATVSAARVCRGTTVTVDGTSSFAVACPGSTLEYRVLGPGLPGTWQATPSFPGLVPDVTTTYTLEVRCVALPSCSNSDTVQVRVDRVPDLNPANVRAADVSTCNQGIQVTWTPATFYGGSAINHYNIYRSTVSCADAVTRIPYGTVQTPATSFDDSGTALGVTYFYVVEAEDGTAGSICPSGPRGGARTRVDANGGTCVAIIDAIVVGQPDLLPRVGTSLRLGGDSAGGAPRYGETFVELTWTTDRALSAGEHFHVLRSDRPDSGFLQRNTEPPFITTGRFTDFGADQPNDGRTHVFYYLVFTADECELDNSDFDIFTTPI